MDWRTYKPDTYKVYTYGIGIGSNHPQLRNCPKTYTVGASTGHVDHVDASGIGGWVWKSAAPNLPIRAHIYIYNSQGEQVWAISVEASQYRADLKNLGYGNGNHGFNVAVPWGNFPKGTLKVNVYAVDGSGTNPTIYSQDINNPCVYGDTDGDYNTTLSSTPRLDSVQEDIDNANSTFNQMPLWQHAIEDNNLFVILSLAEATDFFGDSMGYPDASDSLGHFLDASGTDYSRNFLSMNNNWGYASDNRITEVNRDLAAAEYFGRTTSFIKTSYQKLGDAGNHKDSPPNWYYAVGNYNITSKCYVTKTGSNTFVATIHLSFEDEYDWDPTKTSMGHLPVSPADLYELHYAGLAREYLNKGTNVMNVSWSTGQRYNTGAVITQVS